MSRDTASAAVAEAEAWLRRRGVPHHRTSPYQLKIGDINFYPGKGTITIDNNGPRQPDGGLPALEWLLRRRGFLPRRARGAEGGQEWASEQRDHRRSIRQLREEKREIARERDVARQQRKAAERRLAEKTAECDALRTELRKRPPGGAGAHRAEAQHATRAPRGQHGADEKIRAAKRAFAKMFHPDQAAGGTAEKAVREMMFKAFWPVLERIERG